MLKTRQKNNKVCREINQDLKILLKKIRNKYRLQRAILYGSFARGDYNKASDIDLILVSNEFKGRIFDRVGIVLNLYKGKRDLEPLVYQQEEFEKMVREERPFIISALKEGIDLTMKF